MTSSKDKDSERGMDAPIKGTTHNKSTAFVRRKGTKSKLGCPHPKQGAIKKLNDFIQGNKSKQGYPIKGQGT